jgi:hypothetical protein
VVAKACPWRKQGAEWLPGSDPQTGEANPRFVVTSLPREEHQGQHLYEKVSSTSTRRSPAPLREGLLRARRHGGPDQKPARAKAGECQLDLFADRTPVQARGRLSARTMRANQLRLWFASMAYVLLCALRGLALAHTRFARATGGTIRLRLLKIGALVRTSVRRIKLAMPSAFPDQAEYRAAHAALAASH